MSSGVRAASDSSSHPQAFMLQTVLCQGWSMQDNDVERETTLNRDHLDYLVEESWRWLLSCEFAMHPMHCFLHLQEMRESAT